MLCWVKCLVSLFSLLLKCYVISLMPNVFNNAHQVYCFDDDIMSEYQYTYF